MAILGFTREFLLMVVPLTGYAFGSWIDRQESLRMTRFRDKSALYGRTLAPGEPPSWP
ncbi:NADH dehydrogenase [ubiquinone] 1 beta subcomplex subunit 1 [Neodiprion pinetum]|uniref:NADH dehydrogenase [ubiquinone] 1 beta subcomplex subunit 1 n=1 Tax=Neodiprion lecontei TaxID=441921 RepID=A0A6J0BQQ0_NEOLC|nr:NADH dehydrogenase [ubiquinone] 1 beta subcomplex subunit 1 [Neodiprion lecontei]XP_046410116.1 NADH dehydrogenase [ubiquinone] 1 beta subcomplex subunit 1 [Neodiprion fabricii]XP_046470526.1 NADH dehydrogenase [ubiquinone] 1 beta subcomplex subunit 1 [Neodiprion pinetum]XP_046603267.1 NADH dehydrogenase [ubiquinone] 1 beta subcomplex subunit 1 [Neodiprion virginianus]